MNRELWEVLFFMAVGYLMGSVLFGRILPKHFKDMDIEKVSADHNPGTANVMKYAGIPLGLLCLVLDIGKGYLPVLWAASVVGPVRLLFAGVMVAPVLGHAFPFWRDGRGGKAIAVSFGVLLGVLTGLFRLFGGSAEGVSYAIIISNILVPLIEKVTLPKAFGKEGK